MTNFSVAASRSSGERKTFTAPSSEQAFNDAFQWMDAERNVAIAARNLLDQIKGNTRDMLEECDESGETAAAFAALETALNRCNPA